ncbi:PilZ domain-containing protein [Alteromonas pelagimontana]|uniref:PilZ domain-containing protein n=1 Tax=Alteromonas pelagimontana TaxID=1858656 RepID=A0A6M4MJ27_9ALTE|nr:PilZ domain-containing protein [Alteromonas pelagimontana]QJR82106.1 PilZ domain-containing protein [Alteromonas pelagimontana]
MTDKRMFQRVAIGVAGKLSHQQASINVTVVDLSLQGLRISADEKALETLPFDSHDPYTITFQANGDSPEIVAHLQQLYRQTDTRRSDIIMGCKVDHIDVESLAALRRLIQLNSRHEDVSEKDLNAFIEAIYGKASSASES